jgi:hypothetical protein
MMRGSQIAYHNCHSDDPAGTCGKNGYSPADINSLIGPFWMWKVPDDAPTQTFYQA